MQTVSNTQSNPTKKQHSASKHMLHVEAIKNMKLSTLCLAVSLPRCVAPSNKEKRNSTASNQIDEEGLSLLSLLFLLLDIDIH
jgi:hypothetical protein